MIFPNKASKGRQTGIETVREWEKRTCWVVPVEVDAGVGRPQGTRKRMESE